MKQDVCTKIIATVDLLSRGELILEFVCVYLTFILIIINIFIMTLLLISAVYRVEDFSQLATD